MSYCRFGEGDVYLYEDVAGGYTCCGCRLAGPSHFDTRKATLEHLFDHRDEGHCVPQHAIYRLQREIAEEAAQ